MLSYDMKYLKDQFERRGFQVVMSPTPVHGEEVIVLKKDGNEERFLYISKYFVDFIEKRTYVNDFVNSCIDTFDKKLNEKKGNTEMNKLMNLANAKEVYLNCDGTIIPIKIESIHVDTDMDVRMLCTLPSVIETPYHKCYRKDIDKPSPVEIKDVIFNPPATIVFWSDGKKTVVKAGEHDIYDPEKGLAMAISKRVLGNEGNYYNEIRKWVEPYLKKQAEKISALIEDFTSEQPEEALLWKIWFNDNAGIVGHYYKSYKRRCNAVQVANRLSAKNPDLNYVVSQTNPWGEESDASCQE